MSTLEGRIDAIRERIDAACRRAGRPPSEIRLVAVSKTVDETVIAKARTLGVGHFGENRVQDANRKFGALSDPGLTLHLIGQLQTNKARAAAKIAHELESVDRLNLIETLGAESRKLVDRNELKAGDRLPVLLQVNVAREEQKSGCSPEDASGLVEALLAAPTLQLSGLMTIAPFVATAEEARPTFVALRKLREDLMTSYPEANLATLSMGMTNDFEVAIEEGATSIRVGRAIFAP